MSKKMLKGLLMAALVCGLSLSVASCKDDDEKNSGDADEQEQTVMPASANDDATVLGTLLTSWVEDFSANDVEPGILNKKYEATVGEIIDASQPTVRTLVVGTQEAADAYVRNALGGLGIGQEPVGFTWSNAAIGSVSYSRGTGNELGVVTVSVKQLTGLTKLRLVKDEESNAPTTAYYSKGDIVKYTKDNKYYICLNDHSGGSEATWISFDCGEDVNNLSVGTCGWSGVGDDLVYNKSMASDEALLWWLKEFILNEDNYEEVLSHMAGEPKTAINQIVPSTKELRSNFVFSIMESTNNVVLDINTPINGEDELRADKYLDEEEDMFRDREINASKVVRTYYPIGKLLSGAMRWSMGFTYDYWVPYIVMVPKDYTTEFSALLRKVPSQSSSKSHFEWQLLGEARYSLQDYVLYRVAMHWTHKLFQKGNTKYYNLVDFTMHKRKYQGSQVDLTRDADLDWALRNVTSRTLVVKDKGVANSKFQHVYCAKEVMGTKEPKVGWVLGRNGKFYATEAAAEAAKTTAAGVVAYYNRSKRVETGTDYTGLVVASDIYNLKKSPRSPIGSYCFEFEYLEGEDKFHECFPPLTVAEAAKTLNGLAVTTSVREKGCGLDHNHPVFEAPELYYKIDSNIDCEFSEWFVPSAGQWVLAAEGLTGEKADSKTGEFAMNLSAKWKWPLQKGAIDGNMLWTSTCAVDNTGSGDANSRAYGFEASGTFSLQEREALLPVRLMIAFKMKN